MSYMKQHMSQKMLQRLSPQQIQFIKLLQLNTLDFEEKLDQELLDNPALETGKNEEEDPFSNAEDDLVPEEEPFSRDVDIDELLRYNDDDGGFRLNEDYGDEEYED